MTKVAVMIDGGYLREIARRFRYNPDFIEMVAHQVVANSEVLFRAFYYDCDPFVGMVKLPVTGKEREFKSKRWLPILAAKDNFAVRKGVLKFRGFKPKKVPVSPAKLNDEDFYPDFEQKGVDMRIGLDIATFAQSGAIERIILISGDTDCVPALKHGRIAGLQIVIAQFPGQKISRELLYHADECRPIDWPAKAELFERH